MSKKRENTLLNMALSLFLISIVAAITLAGVYSFTKEPIAKVKKEKTENAIREVLPEFDRIERSSILPYDGGKDSLIIYTAFSGDEISGYAVESYTLKGFSGLIKVMVGFTPELVIVNTAVLEHKETPGLGTKMSDESFKSQFENVNPKEFNINIKKDGGEVDGITAATISARAFSDAVDRAYKTMDSKMNN